VPFRSRAHEASGNRRKLRDLWRYTIVQTGELVRGKLGRIVTNPVVSRRAHHSFCESKMDIRSRRNYQERHEGTARNSPFRSGLLLERPRREWYCARISDRKLWPNGTIVEVGQRDSTPPCCGLRESEHAGRIGGNRRSNPEVRGDTWRGAVKGLPPKPALGGHKGEGTEPPRHRTDTQETPSTGQVATAGSHPRRHAIGDHRRPRRSRTNTVIEKSGGSVVVEGGGLERCEGRKARFAK